MNAAGMPVGHRPAGSVCDAHKSPYNGNWPGDCTAAVRILRGTGVLKGRCGDSRGVRPPFASWRGSTSQQFDAALNHGEVASAVGAKKRASGVKLPEAQSFFDLLVQGAIKPTPARSPV